MIRNSKGHKASERLNVWNDGFFRKISNNTFPVEGEIRCCAPPLLMERRWKVFTLPTLLSSCNIRDSACNRSEADGIVTVKSTKVRAEPTAERSFESVSTFNTRTATSFKDLLLLIPEVRALNPDSVIPLLRGKFNLIKVRFFDNISTSDCLHSRVARRKLLPSRDNSLKDRLSRSPTNKAMARASEKPSSSAAKRVSVLFSAIADRNRSATARSSCSRFDGGCCANMSEQLTSRIFRELDFSSSAKLFTQEKLPKLLKLRSNDSTPFLFLPRARAMQFNP
mmetsp:Transcript_40684/g.84691  ORF Transcript_40684/g.84691 Transcript_40684/m.84691 type:complete len:281 (+) Transcript_40684:307-1149(+)